MNNTPNETKIIATISAGVICSLKIKKADIVTNIGLINAMLMPFDISILRTPTKKIYKSKTGANKGEKRHHSPIEQAGTA